MLIEIVIHAIKLVLVLLSHIYVVLYVNGNSDKDPGYIPKLSCDLSSQNILHKFHARQPITELDSESDFLIDQKASKSNLWKKLDWSLDNLGTMQGF